jgi:hypothetical protein
MDDRQLDFKALEFSKTLHNQLQPPMFDGDFRTGDDYARGELLSLHYAKNALLLSARFTPGPDAKSVRWQYQTGQVEFFLIKRDGRYLGTITRQTPEDFLHFSTGEKVSILDGLGHDGHGLGGRQGAHFWCSLRLPVMSITIPITVSAYVRPGWFGGWKEIVIELPRKELYVARL